MDTHDAIVLAALALAAQTLRAMVGIVTVALAAKRARALDELAPELDELEHD